MNFILLRAADDSDGDDALPLSLDIQLSPYLYVWCSSSSARPALLVADLSTFSTSAVT